MVGVLLRRAEAMERKEERGLQRASPADTLSADFWPLPQGEYMFPLFKALGLWCFSVAVRLMWP